MFERNGDLNAVKKQTIYIQEKKSSMKILLIILINEGK